MGEIYEPGDWTLRLSLFHQTEIAIDLHEAALKGLSGDEAKQAKAVIESLERIKTQHEQEAIDRWGPAGRNDMTTSTKGKGGSDIIAQVKSDIAEKGSAIRSLIDDDFRTDKARRRLRTEYVRSMEQDFAASRLALRERIVEDTADLERRLTAVPDGDQATETRRLRQASEIDRHIATARLDSSTVVVDGTPMPKTDRHAIEYAEKAEKAFAGRDYITAQTYAKVSVELGGDGQRVLQAAEDEIYPDRAKARDELADLEVAESTFDADVGADHVFALEGAVRAADGHRRRSEPVSRDDERSLAPLHDPPPTLSRRSRGRSTSNRAACRQQRRQRRAAQSTHSQAHGSRSGRRLRRRRVRQGRRRPGSRPSSAIQGASIAARVSSMSWATDEPSGEAS